MLNKPVSQKEEEKRKVKEYEMNNFTSAQIGCINFAWERLKTN